ncbi:MAG: endolytic transglycosylase MltG [Candidatus Saccharimonadales bacterium]
MDNKKTIKIPIQPINSNEGGLKVLKNNLSEHKWLIVFAIILSLILSLSFGVFVWYKLQLRPVGQDISQLIKVTIDEGSSPNQIANYLENEKIIKSSTAFLLYVRLIDKSNYLQAGSYRLSPAETVPQIVAHLVDGSVDTFSITFYPGSVLVDNTNKTKKYDVTTILKNAGYSIEEINRALNKKYDSPLFEDKPAGTSLEGYIYGETYNFNVGASVEDILKRTFDEFYYQIEKNNLIEDFKKHGLNLYEGITLASIVQREVYDYSDQRQVAQVFYLRLKRGMSLGSDVTYQYIADKTGVPRDPDLDSPYNTRRYTGLPPGPISSPGLNALRAVANPTDGDYLYFLSGDDELTHFAKTQAEHEANIANYCKVKCATP